MQSLSVDIKSDIKKVENFLKRKKLIKNEKKFKFKTFTSLYSGLENFIEVLTLKKIKNISNNELNYQKSKKKKILDKAKLFFKQAKFSRKQVSRLDYFYLSPVGSTKGTARLFFFLRKLF